MRKELCDFLVQEVGITGATVWWSEEEGLQCAKMWDGTDIRFFGSTYSEKDLW